MTITAETASGFYYWFDANYFRKFATNLRNVTAAISGGLAPALDSYNYNNYQDLLMTYRHRTIASTVTLKNPMGLP